MTTSEPPRTWTLPTLNHLAGPSDLADVVCDFLKFQGEFFESVAVRLDRLRALLNIIYHASLSPEEGRLQRFRVFVTPKESNRANLVANFELDLPEDEAGVSALKRLAPAAASMNHMIVVDDSNDVWRCKGLASVAPIYTSTHVGRPEWHILFPDQPWGMTIRVDAPGALRVSTSGAGFKLNAGNISFSMSLMHSRQFIRCSSSMGVNLAKQEGIKVYSSHLGFDMQRDLPVQQVLEHIVAEMQHAGYGGCLVFPGDASLGKLTEKFITSGPSVGAEIVNFHRASMAFRSGVEDIEKFRHLVADWQRGISHILRTADAVAMLSKMDGCVVVNQNFEVTSFGSKLTATPNDPGLPFVHPRKDEPDDIGAVRRLGTRNQSAFDFCRTVPGSTAIVASQDGDVRIVSSSDRGVSFEEGLEATSLAKPNW